MFCVFNPKEFCKSRTSYYVGRSLALERQLQAPASLLRLHAEPLVHQDDAVRPYNKRTRRRPTTSLRDVASVQQPYGAPMLEEHGTNTDQQGPLPHVPPAGS